MIVLWGGLHKEGNDIAHDVGGSQATYTWSAWADVCHWIYPGSSA